MHKRVFELQNRRCRFCPFEFEMLIWAYQFSGFLDVGLGCNFLVSVYPPFAFAGRTFHFSPAFTPIAVCFDSAPTVAGGASSCRRRMVLIVVVPKIINTTATTTIATTFVVFTTAVAMPAAYFSFLFASWAAFYTLASRSGPGSSIFTKFFRDGLIP